MLHRALKLVPIRALRAGGLALQVTNPESAGPGQGPVNESLILLAFADLHSQDFQHPESWQSGFQDEPALEQ